MVGSLNINLSLPGKRLNLEMWIEDDEIDYQRSESIISGTCKALHSLIKESFQLTLFASFQDICYLLRVPFEQTEFNETIRGAILRGVQEYVAMLSPLQCADAMIRETKEHVRSVFGA